jgi:hypothetical protein
MIANYSKQIRKVSDGIVETKVFRFLKTVRANLANTCLSDAQSKAVLKNAELLENGLLDWVNQPSEIPDHMDSERQLHMDYLLHHRLELAKEIAVSFAKGHGLSNRRRKVLENSINYIEENLA